MRITKDLYISRESGMLRSIAVFLLGHTSGLSVRQSDFWHALEKCRSRYAQFSIDEKGTPQFRCMHCDGIAESIRCERNVHAGDPSGPHHGKYVFFVPHCYVCEGYRRPVTDMTRPEIVYRGPRVDGWRDLSPEDRNFLGFAQA